jgi:hypothetical protein
MHIIWDLLALHGAFDLDSDVCAYTVLSSFLLSGLYSKTAIKTMFEAHGRRRNDASYKFLKDSETVDGMKVVAMKKLAKELGLVGVSGLAKADVLKALKPYEESLRYIPAQGIAKIRRYSKHLRNVRSLVSLVGRETVDSLTWLRDNGDELTSFRPIYMIPPSHRLSLVDTFEEKLLMKMYNVGKVYESPKTVCMEDFCLSSAAMDAMPLGAYRETENPHLFARYPMKLYDLRIVLKYAMEKFGGWNGVLEARKKKAARRAERGVTVKWRCPGIVMNECLDHAGHDYLYEQFFMDPVTPIRIPIVDSRVHQRHQQQSVTHGLNTRLLPRHEARGCTATEVVRRKRSRGEVAGIPRVEQQRGIKSQRTFEDPLGGLLKRRDCHGAFIYTCSACSYRAGEKKMKNHRKMCR